MTEVEDGGAARRERVVAFCLAMEDGTRRTFLATITEEEERWEPSSGS